MLEAGLSGSDKDVIPTKPVSVVKRMKEKALNVEEHHIGAPQKQGSTLVEKRQCTTDIRSPGSTKLMYVFSFLFLPFYVHKIYPNVSK